MTVLLTRRSVVQAALESTYNTPATLTTADGVLVSDPSYTVDPSVLERDFARDTLSKQPHLMGRMMAKMEFTTELRGNGKQNSGVIGDAPLIARLFRACGYSLTAYNAAHASPVFAVGDPTNLVSWVAGGTLTNTEAIMYRLEVTTPGASGVAEITVTSDTPGEGSAAAAVTTATPFSLGTEGLTLTPTFTGNLVDGQTWTVWLLPLGLELKPRSDGFESLTLAMNLDGVRHLMPGSFGTFEIDATAGQYATVKWTFMGTYSAPTDAALPSPIYERTLPAQVELAKLRIDDFYAIVEKFTFNQQNDIQVRPDVSSAQGYIGTRIVARNPEGGIDPEADLVANYDFWGRMRNADRMTFQMRVGTIPGNIVHIFAPCVQYTNMTYADRQGIRTYDAGLKFATDRSDDEIMFYLA